VEGELEIDSAGTSGYHDGAPPDRRSVATARARGVQVTGRSRRLSASDLEDFDYVIVMDSENLAEVRRLQRSAGGGARVHRLGEWDPDGSDPDVPDPYFGGERGFEVVHDMVERCCARLLDHIIAERAEA
jgi:protein-tyrosine phosphatase